jgi:pilus assembly protein CpaE
LAQDIYGLIIGGDPTIAAALHEFGTKSNAALHLRHLQEITDATELESTIRIFCPSIVFLDMDDVPVAEYICGLIRKQSSRTQIIGYGSHVTNDLLLMAVRCGLRDVLESPLSEQTVSQALVRAMQQLQDAGGSLFGRRNQIHCFLPAKIGSGASTVAMHTAAGLSRQTNQRVALVDMDFDTGSIEFMFNLPYGQGLGHLTESGASWDETTFKRIVTKSGNLDIVRAGSQGRPVSFDAGDVRNLIGCARSSYDFTCIDLPGALNDYSLAVLEYCDSILLVCEPELASVHMARKRLDFFRELRLENKVRVVLNRSRLNGAMNKSEIEEVLCTTIYATVANDYAGLQKAVLNGRPIDADSLLGRQFAELSRRLSDSRENSSRGPRNGIWNSFRKWIGLTSAPPRQAGQRLLAPPSANSSGLFAIPQPGATAPGEFRAIESGLSRTEPGVGGEFYQEYGT